MFKSGGNQMGFPFGAGTFHHTFQRPVVAFGTAAGEINFRGLRANGGRDLLARDFRYGSIAWNTGSLTAVVAALSA